MRIDIKKLAQLCVKEGVSKKTASYILDEFYKKELKEFLFFYKNYLSKNTVEITTASQLSKSLEKQIIDKYQDNRVKFTVDENVGAGIRMLKGDMTFDFTIKNYINETIIKIKE